VDEGRVRYDVFSVIVELVPAPVVARVPTVLPATLTPHAQRAQQSRELAATRWLAEQGHPVVAPAPAIAPQPVTHDGFSMTFWQLVELADPPEPPTAPETGRQIAALHAALAGCPVRLPFMVPLDTTVPAMLDQLRNRPDLLEPADYERALQEWAVLAPVLTSPTAFAERFPQAVVQPIHGDAPAHNLLRRNDGTLLDSDFEHVTLGPREWDLTFCDAQVVAAYDAEARRPVDHDLLAVLEAARMVQLVACFALVPQLPMLLEGMRPALEHWRTQPTALDLLTGSEPP
jgi:Ser/Thr protein kinase RdoA (MazF antagonist)